MRKLIEIADRLKTLRGALSQEEFAAKIGVSFRTYQYYEGGVRSPKWSTLSKIAEFTGKPVDWILTGEEPASAADRVAEACAPYGMDDVSAKIVDMLRGLDEEARRDVLKYARFIYEEKHKKEVG